MGGSQRIDIVKVHDIGVIAGAIVYNSSVGRTGGIIDLRRDIFNFSRAALKTTTGDVGGSGRGKDGEEGQEEEDGESKGGSGARHRVAD